MVAFLAAAATRMAAARGAMAARGATAARASLGSRASTAVKGAFSQQFQQPVMKMGSPVMGPNGTPLMETTPKSVAKGASSPFRDSEGNLNFRARVAPGHAQSGGANRATLGSPDAPSSTGLFGSISGGIQNYSFMRNSNPGMNWTQVSQPEKRGVGDATASPSRGQQRWLDSYNADAGVPSTSQSMADWKAGGIKPGKKGNTDTNIGNVRFGQLGMQFQPPPIKTNSGMGQGSLF